MELGLRGKSCKMLLNSLLKWRHFEDENVWKFVVQNGREMAIFYLYFVGQIFLYLSTWELPTEMKKARRFKYLVNWFLIINRKLHKWGYTLPYLRCLNKYEAKYIMREIHEGIRGDHFSGRSLSQKALRQGYFWPTMLKDAMELVKIYDKCQRFSHIPRQPREPLTSVSSPWWLTLWRIDIIRTLPLGNGKYKYAIVAIDYFAKWVEAQELDWTKFNLILFENLLFAGLEYPITHN